MIAFRVRDLGRNCKSSCRVYTYCFANNIETSKYFNCFYVPLSYAVYNDQSARLYSLILIFSTLCVVHDLFQRTLSKRRLSIAFVFFNLFALHALRQITFMQHFRTTRDFWSIS